MAGTYMSGPCSHTVESSSGSFVICFTISHGSLCSLHSKKINLISDVTHPNTTNLDIYIYISRFIVLECVISDSKFVFYAMEGAVVVEARVRSAGSRVQLPQARRVLIEKLHSR